MEKLFQNTKFFMSAHTGEIIDGILPQTTKDWKCD